MKWASLHKKYCETGDLDFPLTHNFFQFFTLGLTSPFTNHLTFMKLKKKAHFFKTKKYYYSATKEFSK